MLTSTLASPPPFWVWQAEAGKHTASFPEGTKETMWAFLKSLAIIRLVAKGHKVLGSKNVYTKVTVAPTAD